ncbi:MAG: hypothetical protein IH885_06610 [Myxococcales bacterium]|nr:hypothetical protein [Myxococcales bacterium]
MEIFAYTGEIFVGFVYLIVGIRLYALSARNAQAPDRLLAVTFLFWGLSYFVYDIPEIFFYADVPLPPLFSFSSAITLYLGTITFAVFTRAVFRPQERWALWLVAGMVGCLIVGVAGSVWVGDWGGEYPLSNQWWWVTRVGCAAPLVWMSAEGLTQYANARRRRRLGLCTPQSCNRFLLWGLAGALWVILELVDGAQYFEYEIVGQYSDSLLVHVGWLEAVPGGMIWLIFFPPAFYRRWINANAPVAKAGEG